MQTKTISQSLEAVIQDPSLQDTTASLAEVVLDVGLDGVLKDIPIIGSLVGLGRAVVSVRDRMFLHKLCHLLTEIETVPVEERQRMIQGLAYSKDYAISVGEKLLYIIDRCQDHLTAQKIGRVFRAFLEGTLDYADFVRLSVCIDRLMADDLNDFISKEWINVPVWEAGHLVGTGLVTFDELQIRVEDQWDHKASNRYVVEGDTQTVTDSELGKKLRGILQRTPAPVK